MFIALIEEDADPDNTAGETLAQSVSSRMNDWNDQLEDAVSGTGEEFRNRFRAVVKDYLVNDDLVGHGPLQGA